MISSKNGGTTPLRFSSKQIFNHGTTLKNGGHPFPCLWERSVATALILSYCLIVLLSYCLIVFLLYRSTTVENVQPKPAAPQPSRLSALPNLRSAPLWQTVPLWPQPSPGPPGQCRGYLPSPAQCAHSLH